MAHQLGGVGLGVVEEHVGARRVVDRCLVIHLAGGKHIMEIIPKYATTNYGMLREAMAEGIRGGELRDIDVDLAPISLIGMIIVFQLIRPLIAIGLGKIQFDDRFIERLAVHTVDLFLNGAASPDKQAAGKRAKPSAPQATVAPRNGPRTPSCKPHRTPVGRVYRSSQPVRANVDRVASESPHATKATRRPTNAFQKAGSGPRSRSWRARAGSGQRRSPKAPPGAAQRRPLGAMPSHP